MFLHLAWQADSSRQLGTCSHTQIAGRYVELQVLLGNVSWVTEPRPQKVEEIP